MIAVRAAGDAAVLLETGAAEADGSPAGLAAAIRTAGLPGLVDIVPGARTVLVTFEPGTWSAGELAGRLKALTALPGSGPVPGPGAEIDVVYDGPDLAEVAGLTGLSTGEVVRRHAAARYEVGWLGFAPGFGYLTGLDPALAAVPRLDRPRLRVPAGSVAIAGGLAAVYPAASPGGWRLIGRTSARLWDPGRDQPALLTPGMQVRFRAVDRLPGDDADASGGLTIPAAAGRTAAPASTATSGRATTEASTRTVPGEGPGGRDVEVIQPGPLATIQDLGRPGLAHLGVPASGAADPASLRLANRLAGNPEDAACLELTLGRLSVRFSGPATAALAGAPAPMRLSAGDDDVWHPAPGTRFTVPAGAVLQVGTPATGLRSYLAIGGGIEAPAVLGSQSTDSLSGLGPAPVQAGEILMLGPRPRPATGPAIIRPAAKARELSGSQGGTPGLLPSAGATAVELRAVAGPRDDWFTDEALATLASSEYHVSTASNRTGLRLTGPALSRRQPAELPSEGVATGSLQVTHEGQPILLLADHPTTGGYPVIAVVRSADLGLAAQLRPGQRIRFSLSWP